MSAFITRCIEVCVIDLLYVCSFLGDKAFATLGRNVAREHRKMITEVVDDDAPRMDPIAKKSMLREDLEFVCEYCVRSDTPASYMDRAVLNLDWACVGRISEVASLRVCRSYVDVLYRIICMTWCS